MNAVTTAPKIAPMSPAALDQVRAIESRVLKIPQVPIVTHHVFHAGIYSRTILLPAGCVLTGALIKIATLVIVNGDVSVLVGEGKEIRLRGYNVLPASAGRKQAFIAHSETSFTMQFATQAKTVEEAEREFTDEADRLLSRHGENVVTFTGE